MWSRIWRRSATMRGEESPSLSQSHLTDKVQDVRTHQRRTHTLSTRDPRHNLQLPAHLRRHARSHNLQTQTLGQVSLPSHRPYRRRLQTRTQQHQYRTTVHDLPPVIPTFHNRARRHTVRSVPLLLDRQTIPHSRVHEHRLLSPWTADLAMHASPRCTSVAYPEKESRIV
jgi:hypothetical protein